MNMDNQQPYPNLKNKLPVRDFKLPSSGFFDQDFISFHEMMTQLFGQKDWVLDCSCLESDSPLILRFSMEKFVHITMQMKQEESFPWAVGFRLFLAAFSSERSGYVLDYNYEPRDFCELYSLRGPYVTPIELISCVARTTSNPLVSELFELFFDEISKLSIERQGPIFLNKEYPERPTVSPIKWIMPDADEEEIMLYNKTFVEYYKNLPYLHCQRLSGAAPITLAEFKVKWNNRAP